MLWTMLRWNLGNTSAIAAFCLLPIITFGDANSNDRQSNDRQSNDRQSTDITPFAKLQSANFELTAPLLRMNALAITPSMAPMASTADDRHLNVEPALFKELD